MYALVDIKGKQYKAEKGSTLRVDKIDEEKGKAVEFSTVLLLSDNEKITLGSPYLENVKVKATIEDHGRAKKVVIYKYKRRKGYRKRQVHRQSYTVIKVLDIQGA